MSNPETSIAAPPIGDLFRGLPVKIQIPEGYSEATQACVVAASRKDRTTWLTDQFNLAAPQLIGGNIDLIMTDGVFDRLKARTLIDIWINENNIVNLQLSKSIRLSWIRQLKKFEAQKAFEDTVLDPKNNWYLIYQAEAESGMGEVSAQRSVATYRNENLKKFAKEFKKHNKRNPNFSEITVFDNQLAQQQLVKQREILEQAQAEMKKQAENRKDQENPKSQDQSHKRTHKSFRLSSFEIQQWIADRFDMINTDIHRHPARYVVPISSTGIGLLIYGIVKINEIFQLNSQSNLILEILKLLSKL